MRYNEMFVKWHDCIVSKFELKIQLWKSLRCVQKLHWSKNVVPAPICKIKAWHFCKHINHVCILCYVCFIDTLDYVKVMNLCSKKIKQLRRHVCEHARYIDVLLSKLYFINIMLVTSGKSPSNRAPATPRQGAPSTPSKRAPSPTRSAYTPSKMAPKRQPKDQPADGKWCPNQTLSRWPVNQWGIMKCL